MRKIKSTALLGAFVAVASVGVISHEAHGTTIGTPNNVPGIIAKETLPASSASLQASIIPSVGFNGTSSSSITLKISSASFLPVSYTISGADCSDTPSSATNSLVFTSCTVSANDSYAIITSGSTFSVTVPQGTSSIVLSYSSNVSGDTSSSATIAQVQQQLTVTPANVATAYISPSSLSTFSGGSGSGNSASNTMTISSSTGFSDSIKSDTLNVVFNGIPSSVSSISTIFTATSDTSSSTYTQGTGSATVSLSLNGPSDAVFSSPNSNTATFNFSNSGNIQTGTIYISSITSTSSNSYSYFSGSQNFLTFTIGGTQIYVPDALAHSGSNVITAGYITISMPSSASIASISVLNTSASCPTNGILTSTSTPNLYYIDLNTLASLCTGLTPAAWQSGVPLVIYISGSNASASNITADAYAVFNNMLKRIPVNVLNASSSYANFSY